MLKGDKIYLRPIEEHDVNLILLWENDTENWRYSETEAPYSLLQIQDYVRTASKIRENKQLRLLICRKDNDDAVGAIDLYNIDFKHLRAGIGILIANNENRNQGYAKEAIQITSAFAAKKIGLKQLFCDIQADNTSSIALFEKSGFVKTGTRKDWYLYNQKGIDAYFYQKFI
ncbi:GNAT family N-acetyltransferase [Brumimicrobium aurantiacum]|uniref:N-acetyltransferase n=1 Tax=Brumimicrobium aurantiacum TaxID=1737063 RepID=A0A3E1F034_9FLAO|nr:GNAT family N-acetyltransferase [Brumimicrobium aurantiacum]RFC55176.1 N-acetyltransferase [Brumimicrobium aurantiacum]